MENLEPLANLSAVTCLIGLAVWSVTKGIPRLLETFREETRQQRNDFCSQLAQERQQSREIADAGIAAIHQLSETVDGLRREIIKDRKVLERATCFVGDCSERRTRPTATEEASHAPRPSA